MSEIQQGLSFRENLGFKAAPVEAGGTGQGRDPAALQRPGSPWGLTSLLACSPGLLGTHWAGPGQLSRLTSWVAVWCFPDAAPTQQGTETNEAKQSGARLNTGLWAASPRACCGTWFSCPRPSRWGSPAVPRPLWVWCTLLSLNVQETKIMASDPITSWQRDGETVETVADFIFLGSKITADGDCSHEIKRRLLLGRFVYDKPRQHVKEQRHHFSNKGPYSQSYGFSNSHVRM